MRPEEPDPPQEQPSARPPKCMLHFNLTRIIGIIIFTLLLSLMSCSYIYRIYNRHLYFST